MKFELVIEFDPETKSIELGKSTPGLLNDRLLCYGMLGMAREVLTTNGVRMAMQGQPNIVPAPAGMRFNGR